MSGLHTFGVVILGFSIMAWLISRIFYNAIDSFLGKLWSSFRGIHLIFGLGTRRSITRYSSENEECQGVS